MPTFVRVRKDDLRPMRLNPLRDRAREVDKLQRSLLIAYPEALPAHISETCCGERVPQFFPAGNAIILHASEPMPTAVASILRSAIRYMHHVRMYESPHPAAQRNGLVIGMRKGQQHPRHRRLRAFGRSRARKHLVNG
jgi:hypothetical protein